ncbi:MFS transporter [Winogradskyella jejuensis]|uniref:Major Facilitator Superfamily protein n=1 Tax=Winogradskyella jejuensis TaxID=1089305 RepID=A0A1M5SFJ4_9FLAO|nr:MFS transporter [Winogradskyella jejuensis]SHH37367.1 Major Facilitator Superfamily protein [Winogradskyella jejuensis]
MSKTNLEKLYDYLNNESEQRVCKGLTDDACEYTVPNFFRVLLTHTFTKLGDTLSNPKTVLTWLMSYVNAPVYLISLIVPIRESGAMIPQIAISNYINKKKIRKWIWVIGSVLQFVSIGLIGVVALFFKNATAGWLIVACLIFFSLARSLCSVTSKDVIGKTIPKTRRGRLSGYTVLLSGVLVLLAGLYIIYKSNTNAGVNFYTNLMFFASFMWIFAALIYSTIKEFPGEVSSNTEDKQTAFSKFSLLKTDTQFRNFVIARSLLLCSALSAPFYVLLAQEYVGKESYLLGLLILANGIASVVSSPFWGKMADNSSKNTMSIAVVIASVLSVFMVVLVTFSETLRSQLWLYPIAFFVLGIAHGGVRLGRKTYVVDMAKGNQRTDYVSVSNTVIGLILLLTGGLSALVSLISIEGVILALSLFGFYGAFRSYKLPNVE